MSEVGFKDYINGAQAAQFSSIRPLQAQEAIQRSWDKCNMGCQRICRAHRRCLSLRSSISYTNVRDCPLWNMNRTDYNPAIHYPKRNRTMKSGSYRRSAYFHLACFILLTAACGEQKSVATAAQLYKKGGVNLALPEGWDVVQDVQYDSGIRSIEVLTDVGSIASIDVYPTSSYDEEMPTLDEYSKSYLRSSLNYEEARNKALIDYGEANRGGIQGVFYDVTLPEPFNVQYFLEFYLKRSTENMAYISFNTRKEYLDNVQPFIGEFVDRVDLEK